MVSLKVVPIGFKSRLDERMKLALEAMPVAVAWTRLDDGRVEFTNERYKSLFGYSKDDFADVFELMQFAFVDQEQGERAIQATRGLVGQTVLEPFTVPDEEVVARRKDGSTVRTSFSGVVLPEANMMLVTFVDITATKEREELLERLASTDPLTGLANRREFDSMVAAAASPNGAREHFGIMILDLDGFKQLNDIYGHETGDELLKRFGRTLVSVFRTSDTLARWGGDEFAVLVRAPVSGKDMAEAAERLNAALGDPCMTDGFGSRVSVSAGWAIFPDDGDSPSTLFQAADANMYKNKSRRRRA